MSAAPRRLLTAEEFAALPSEGMRLELVRGEIAAMPPAFRDHGNIASKIHIAVGHYIVAHKLGETYTAETGFLLARNPDTIRAPDFAFIAASRAPDATTPDGWVDVIPDLIIEVVSSGDRMTEVRDKIQMWLEAGVRRVWVVYPALHVVEVWRPGQAERALRAEDTLEGEEVVPGFSVSVKDLLG